MMWVIGLILAAIVWYVVTALVAATLSIVFRVLPLILVIGAFVIMKALK